MLINMTGTFTCNNIKYDELFTHLTYLHSFIDYRKTQQTMNNRRQQQQQQQVVIIIIHLAQH